MMVCGSAASGSVKVTVKVATAPSFTAAIVGVTADGVVFRRSRVNTVLPAPPAPQAPGLGYVMVYWRPPCVNGVLSHIAAPALLRLPLDAPELVTMVHASPGVGVAR